MCTSGTRARVCYRTDKIPQALYDGYRLRFRRGRFVMKEIKLDEPN